MKNYNKNGISASLQYQDANNWWWCAMWKKLPVSSFKWDNMNLYTEETIEIYNENSKYGALLDIDIDYAKELHELHLDVPFLAERKVINSTSNLITSFENRNKYAVHIFALKQALNHGLKF